MRAADIELSTQQSWHDIINDPRIKDVSQEKRNSYASLFNGKHSLYVQADHVLFARLERYRELLADQSRLVVYASVRSLEVDKLRERISAACEGICSIRAELRKRSHALTTEIIELILKSHNTHLEMQEKSRVLKSPEDIETQDRVQRAVNFLYSPQLAAYRDYHEEGMLSDCEKVGCCMCDTSDNMFDSCLFNDQTVLRTVNDQISAGLQKIEQDPDFMRSLLS